MWFADYFGRVFSSVIYDFFSLKIFWVFKARWWICDWRKKNMMLKDDEYDSWKDEYDVEIVGVVVVIESFLFMFWISVVEIALGFLLEFF